MPIRIIVESLVYKGFRDRQKVTSNIQDSFGSGVIIKHEGDTYTILAAAHVVKSKSEVYAFKDGKVIANSSRELEGGYGIVYSCNTLPGMSGGGIFNDNGELIAIHGKGDVDEKYKSSQENENIRFKTGNDLGIPIDTFVRLANNVGVNTGIEPPVVVANTAPKASDFLVSAVAKHKTRDFQGAFADYDRAIQLNPNYGVAYYGRGSLKY